LESSFYLSLNAALTTTTTTTVTLLIKEGKPPYIFFEGAHTESAPVDFFSGKLS